MQNSQLDPASRSASALRLVLGACSVLALAGCNWLSVVSVNNEGELANSHSLRPSLSSDGRYVAFRSAADNLVEGSEVTAVFLRDTLAGTTTLVSVDSAGNPGEYDSFVPDISGDGRYVGFSTKSSLVAEDTNGKDDVYLHDTLTGTTTRVSVDSAGNQGTGGDLGTNNAHWPHVSENGRYVAFLSISPLASNDTDDEEDIFLRDTVTGTTTLVSANIAGYKSSRGVDGFDLSDDGRYVAFYSHDNTFVPDDNNGRGDIFLRDTVAGVTTRVSVDSAGNEANYSSELAAISGDGRYVAFRSEANNLVADDTNSSSDVFLRDTVGGTTTRVSVDSAGNEGNDDSGEDYTGVGIAISADGRYVAFRSDASNLVANDTNGVADIFIRDTVGGITTRASVDMLGTQANLDSHDPAISGNGRYVAFETFANALTGRPGWYPISDIMIRFVPEVTIASVIPDHLPIGATTSVTVTGTNFMPGAVLALGGAQKSNIVVVDENTITVDVTVPLETEPGSRALSVLLLGPAPALDHGAGGICENCVTYF